MTINEPSQFRKELTQFPRHALVTPQAWKAPRRRTRSRRRSPSARRATTDRSHDLGRAGLGLGRRYEARPDSPRTRHGAHSWTLSKVFSFRFDDSWANISIPCSHRPSIESQTGNGRRARPGPRPRPRAAVRASPAEAAGAAAGLQPRAAARTLRCSACLCAPGATTWSF